MLLSASFSPALKKIPNGETHQQQEKGIDWFVEEMRPQDAEALHRLEKNCGAMKNARLHG